MDHAYHTGTLRAAGSSGDPVAGTGSNGIGLPDVGPGSVRPVVPGCLSNAHGMIEGSRHTAPDPAAPKEGHATAGKARCRIGKWHPSTQQGKKVLREMHAQKWLYPAPAHSYVARRSLLEL